MDGQKSSLVMIKASCRAARQAINAVEMMCGDSSWNWHNMRTMLFAAAAQLHSAQAEVEAWTAAADVEEGLRKGIPLEVDAPPRPPVA